MVKRGHKLEAGMKKNGSSWFGNMQNTVKHGHKQQKEIRRTHVTTSLNMVTDLRSMNVFPLDKKFSKVFFG